MNDQAIFNGAGSGALSIVNLGAVNGFVILNDGEDDLDNQGEFTARGDSDFGTGLDSVLNNGTLRLADSGGADHVAFLGLESFANGPSGLITMMDGKAGDRLSFPSLTAFHGGGVLALDAELAGTGSPADLLTLSGVVSGRTLVRVNNTSKLPGVRGADNIFVIDQGSVPTGSEFALENGPIPVGFLYYDLRPDDDGSTFWELYQSGRNQKKIDELSVLMTGLQNLWHAGVSAWHQRMGDLVTLAAMPELQPAADFPGAPPLPRMQGGLWLRGYGEQARYDTTVSVDFRQDIEGFQGGLDGVIPGPLGGDSVIAGLLGGFVRSDLDFKGAPDNASYEGNTLGAYLTYLNGGFHADLLFQDRSGHGDLRSAWAHQRLRRHGDRRQLRAGLQIRFGQRPVRQPPGPARLCVEQDRRRPGRLGSRCLRRWRQPARPGWFAHRTPRDGRQSRGRALCRGLSDA
jgi:outer membrane autotransporter protein